MISEKRTRKPPEVFEIPERRPQQKDKPAEKKRKVSGCNYELIQVPQKHQDEGEIFLVYGNAPFMQKDDRFTSDMSMLNDFHYYRGVYTAEYEGQKMVVIKTERRPEKRFHRWKTLVKKMSQGGRKIKDLAQVFKGISLSFETLAQDYFNKVSTLYAKKGGKEKVAAFKAGIDNQKREMFRDYPYIQLRSSFQGYQTVLEEFIVNERFLHITGYTVESFASTVISDGLPPMLEMRLDESDDIMQNANNYAANQAANNHLRSPTLDFFLHTRSKYTQEAKVQTHILINHDQSEYKCDAIYTVVDHNSPFSLPPVYKGPIFTKAFINLMQEREKEMEKFFMYFPSDVSFPRFSNKDKICKIKEIKSIKDEEEEKESMTTAPSSIF